MSLFQIAKILEISGVFLATFVGGILLNPEMFGRFVVRADTWLRNFSQAFTHKCLPILTFASLVSTNEFTKSLIGATGLRGIATTCIIIGWMMQITWLFWLGIALACPYLLISIFFVFLRIRSRFGIAKMWLYPILLCWSLILSFVLAPIALLIYLLFLYALLAVLYIFTYLIGSSNVLKRNFIILGSILILIGLILETVIIW